MQVAAVEERALNGREACHLLGVCLSHLYALMRDEPGFPPGVRLGRSRRWMASDLLRWMDKKAKTPGKRLGRPSRFSKKRGG